MIGHGKRLLCAASGLEVEGRVLMTCGGGGYSHAGHRLVAAGPAGLDEDGSWLSHQRRSIRLFS